MMRLTRASPILFSILVSSTVVLYLHHERKGKNTRRWDIRSDEELVLNVDEVFRHLDGYPRQYSQRRFEGAVPLRKAFWIECSTRAAVPSDHGPVERHICISQVPVKPRYVSSAGLNSGGGMMKGIFREWFYGSLSINVGTRRIRLHLDAQKI